jgi:peptidoglycan/LPS O-acetylase OafA/YrhL
MLENSRPWSWVYRLHALGILGVEIFFVLSGFLIGGILLDLMEKGRFEAWPDLLRFWSRRWLRTLPLYYLFLAVYLWFDWKGPARLRDHLDFLFFLQNFAWKAPDFFLVSWSLPIEEFFYLLFPLALFLLRRGPVRDPYRGLPAALGLFLIGPLLLKLARAPYADWYGFDQQLRMQTVTRLDSLMYGVGAVFVKRRYPALWRALADRSAWGLALALAVCVYLYMDLPGLIGSRWLEALFFPLVSLSVALVLPFFDGLRSRRPSRARALIAYVSTVSYSIYLGHVLVLTRVNAALERTPGAWGAVWERPLRLYPLYVALILALATLTYYGWERPFLRLRDRSRASSAGRQRDA